MSHKLVWPKADKNFWKNCPKPIVGVAPMDGYSDSAFRRVCKLVNPSIITYTEFTSADGIHYNANKVKKRLQFDASEAPILAQIFGKNLETFETATKVCTDMGFTGIDLNMGCPSKKVVKSEHGVALRKKPDLAYKVIETVARATHLPVSVKTRLGWDNADGLIEFCQGAESAGADMICIHARTYKVPYRVPAQFEPVYEMKRKVGIPILGNGGIVSIVDGMAKLGNLDGFLIGQATFGNPWVFSEAGKPPRLKDRLDVMRYHSKWLIDSKGESVGCREIRKHLLSYIKGFDGAKIFRSRLSQVDSLDAVMVILDELATLDFVIDATAAPELPVELEDTSECATMQSE